MQKNHKIILGAVLVFSFFSVSLFGLDWRNWFTGWRWPSWSLPTLSTKQKIGLGAAAVVSIPPAVYLAYNYYWPPKKADEENKKWINDIVKELKALKGIKISGTDSDVLHAIPNYERIVDLGIVQEEDLLNKEKIDDKTYGNIKYGIETLKTEVNKAKEAMAKGLLSLEFKDLKFEKAKEDTIAQDAFNKEFLKRLPLVDLALLYFDNKDAVLEKKLEEYEFIS